MDRVVLNLTMILPQVGRCFPTAVFKAKLQQQHGYRAPRIAPDAAFAVRVHSKAEHRYVHVLRPRHRAVIPFKAVPRNKRKHTPTHTKKTRFVCDTRRQRGFPIRADTHKQKKTIRL